jgi:hypothetical protein
MRPPLTLSAMRYNLRQRRKLTLFHCGRKNELYFPARRKPSLIGSQGLSRGALDPEKTRNVNKMRAFDDRCAVAHGVRANGNRDCSMA